MVDILLSSEVWRGKIAGKTGHIITMDPSVPEADTKMDNNNNTTSKVPVIKQEKIVPSKVKAVVLAKRKASSDAEEPKGSLVHHVSRCRQNMWPEIKLGSENNNKVIIPDSKAEKDEEEELESKEGVGNGDESDSRDSKDKFKPDASPVGSRKSGKSARSGRK
ncbi:hypothetical protein CALCODRAFT_489103 [Calocera cornea HHB12733]|uniref:Uncharacterized protein n=1 Tax=Calocera cornea HHB12733 TaxID=1353952 RepID=A0A166LBJ5_9BASI|nr:hypothetical protein CALCODRAFT_489103 [Calocera cornea HHB12733]